MKMKINCAYRNPSVCLYTSKIRRSDFTILNTKLIISFAIFCQIKKKGGMGKDAFAGAS